MTTQCPDNLSGIKITSAQIEQKLFLSVIGSDFVPNWHEVTQAEKRISELDRLFVKIYEDNAKGKLSDEHFSMMSANYEEEQKKFRMDTVELQKNIEDQERRSERREKFLSISYLKTNL